MHCSSNNKNNLYHSASKPLCPQPILMVIVSAMIRAICSCKRKKKYIQKTGKRKPAIPYKHQDDPFVKIMLSDSFFFRRV